MRAFGFIGYFSNPQEISGLNGTLIVLIPKKDPPETMQNLRLISLCNVIYKVITKIVAKIIKEFLPLVTSPFQFSFVSG